MLTPCFSFLFHICVNRGLGSFAWLLWPYFSCPAKPLVAKTKLYEAFGGKRRGELIDLQVNMQMKVGVLVEMYPWLEYMATDIIPSYEAARRVNHIVIPLLR